eukprot:CAMPEP_0204401992 /NCGR_PEP_ID=MMETSP0470-20130426/5030_1 /ASSEMBLY_ACC=CAM_ASM_000385 /TAXON_ID=2969 /ORGANISM="Oxyrrhis marina" /LENGTH=56 /DNA_ID=CAMNT_0051397025 /DNA_START=180 /DNA_END=346 /DNA_ORIENTATION=-
MQQPQAHTFASIPIPNGHMAKRNESGENQESSFNATDCYSATPGNKRRHPASASYS